MVVGAGGVLIHLEAQVDLRLIVEANHEVGHQLEEVLPEAQEHVQVEVADVHLAVNPQVVQVAHALEAVDVVEAEAPVHARVGGAFVHVRLTPAGTNGTNLLVLTAAALTDGRQVSYQCPVKPGRQSQPSRSEQFPPLKQL